MAAMEKRLVDTIASTDAQQLMDQWLPMGVQGPRAVAGHVDAAGADGGGPATVRPQAEGIAAGLPGDTIYAPATAAGRAPVGVLRISGPAAAAAARLLTGKDPPPPRTAALRRLRDPDTGEAIDQALLLWFPAPRSETGEDVLEVQHHGGAAVLARLAERARASTGRAPGRARRVHPSRVPQRQA